jgi:predicted Rossmann fold flavoprotein
VKICPARPALVPFLFSPEDCKCYSDLAGVSAEVVTSHDGQRFREKMLFTHRGLSGPAILQISSYWQPGEPVSIDLAPEREVTSIFCDPKAPRTIPVLKSAMREFLPQRLVDRWMEFHAPQVWTNTALTEFEKQLHDWQLTPAGAEGYEKAEVTAGGVDTDELSAKTMESIKVRGLYFVGEVVDVTGHLGGFNFQWAWASGAAAGRAV